MKKSIITCFIIIATIFNSSAQIKKFETDSFPTASGGKLIISFIGHGSLMLNYNGIIIHVDPSMLYADYSTLPKAQLILITHHHSDHLDSTAISKIYMNGTQIILPQASQTFFFTFLNKLKQGLTIPVSLLRPLLLEY